MPKLTMIANRAAAFGLALLALGIAGVARTARAQRPAADSLAALLATPDIHARAVAVARLNALPMDELTPGARTALVALLDAEATGRVPADPNVVPDEDETYDEYVMDLTDAVLKLRDPASLRGLTLVGIQTGDDVQQYIASLGASSLAALDEAWSANVNARPAVIETWGIALTVTGPTRLGVIDRQRVLGSIMAAIDSFPIPVAGAAREASLVALVPSLTEVAATTSSEVVKSRAEKALAVLAPAREALTAPQILGQATALLRGFCAGTSSPNAGHPNRPSTCGVIVADMNRAMAAIRTARPDDARIALGSAAATASDARTLGVLTAAEAASVIGNVQYLLGRI